MPRQGDRYQSTRSAWEDIWDEASIEVELEAAGYTRAQETIRAYLPLPIAKLMCTSRLAAA